MMVPTALCYLVYSPARQEFRTQAVDGGVYLFGTYYQQVQRLQLPLPEQNGLVPAPVGIGTISFDTQQELLWTGSNRVSESSHLNICAISDPRKGRITSFYGPDVQKYTSLQAHPAQEGAVAQFLFNERGVISLASRSIHMISRRGLTQWHISFVLTFDLLSGVV